MCAENHRTTGGHLGQLLDKYCPLRTQIIANKFVMDDLMPHIDRRAKTLQRPLDDSDGALDAGTEATRIGENKLHLHDPDNVHLEPDGLSSQRVIEVEQGVRVVNLTQEAGKSAAVRGSEFDD